MLLIIFLAVCLLLFPAQLLLCFYAKKTWVRLLPVALLAVYLAVSLILAGGAQFLGLQSDSALAGIILLVIGIYLAIADGIAWMVWGIRKYSQNRRKLFVM